MKKTIFAFGLMLIISSCAYQKIGAFTMVSIRNVDSSKKYVLIKRNVEFKAKTKHDDALERAIDKATKTYEGEYMMNVKIYVKGNGKIIKIDGDVWGFKSTTVNVESSVNKKVEFETGDAVTFKLSGSILEGKIIGINVNGAIIEYKNTFGQLKKKEIAFDDLTKIER